MAFRDCIPIWLPLAGVAVAGAAAQRASAQSSSQRPAAMRAVGTWRGTSVCLMRSSACSDEVVVYRIARTTAAYALNVDARKLVRGEEQEMGVLACRLTSPEGPLVCAIPRGVWRFSVRNDSLVGELRLSDGTKFRDVRMVRAP